MTKLFLKIMLLVEDNLYIRQLIMTVRQKIIIF